jgi:putative protease
MLRYKAKTSCPSCSTCTKGTCTNACRWEYKPSAAEERADGAIIPMEALNAAEGFSCAGGQKRHPLADQVYFLEEKNRPNELMPIFEDEHGTYIMNSKDLRAIEHVQRLVDIGIDCLKIEGRTKSHYYVARTAQAYRQAIDDAAAGQPLNPQLIGALESLSNRGYTDGFYQRHHSEEHQNYISGSSRSHRQEFVGEMLGAGNEEGWILVDVKNKFQVGDRIEFVLPDGGNIETTLEQMRDAEGVEIKLAPGNGHKVMIPYTGSVSGLVLISRFL